MTAKGHSENMFIRSLENSFPKMDPKLSILGGWAHAELSKEFQSLKEPCHKGHPRTL